MVKKKNAKKHSINILLIIILITSTLLNILIITKYQELKKEDITIEQVLFTKTNDNYSKDEKYYANIKYKKFNELWTSDKISTIAIVDNSSTTYNKFKQMINKTAYYKNTKIYLLETSKLSKKDEKKFYEKDKRLSELETNYIITISNKKIVSITTFDNNELNKIIERLGD